MNQEEDTIAAISTPIGEGGIGVVRLSGVEAARILAEVFRGASGKPRKKFESHKVNYGFVVGKDGKKIDEVMATLMKAPLTYTREDVVEISCHGGSAVLKQVLRLALDSGARMAAPGEFSKRAFLNGRIDLLQAEAIIDLIRSTSEKGWTTAFSQLDGRLSHAVREMEEQFVEIIANIEASIDFPEDEIEIIDDTVITNKLQVLKENISNITETYIVGRVYREGVAVAIAGRPNVGKSSLLNALLERDRAIVTPHPGTTRDTIEETLHIDGIAIRVIDTAGVREANDPAETAGISKTIQAVENADIVLIMFDGAEPFHHEDQKMVEQILALKGNSKSLISVVNKSDLVQKIDTAKIRTLVAGEPVSISAKNGSGIEAIKKRINQEIDLMGQSLGEGPVLTRERHLEKFKEIEKSITSAISATKQKLSREYVAADLQEPKEALQELTGKVVEDSILEKIFNEFCIGK